MRTPKPVVFRLERTRSAGSRPLIFVVGALVGIALAILKPWDLGRPPGREEPGVAVQPVVSSADGSSPTLPTPGQTSWTSLVARSWQCYYASDWRVFALGVPIDRLAGIEPGASPAPGTPGPPTGTPSLADYLDPIRTWIQTDPFGGLENPADPRIPFVRIVDAAIPALGYCAPTSVPDRPPADARTSAWSLAEDGSATAIRLRTIAGPHAPGDSTEGLFVRDTQDASAETDWVAGRYVFVVRDPKPGGYARWFGVEIIDPPGPLPSFEP